MSILVFFYSKQECLIPSSITTTSWCFVLVLVPLVALSQNDVIFVVLFLRWSAIATHLPKRTDNEIKNYWNTHLKKRLAKMGIDPITHKPKNDALSSNDSKSKNAANLSHMAQWESARLEAEARLARQSKLRFDSSTPFQVKNNSLFSSCELSSLFKIK